MIIEYDKKFIKYINDFKFDINKFLNNDFNK